MTWFSQTHRPTQILMLFRFRNPYTKLVPPYFEHYNLLYLVSDAEQRCQDEGAVLGTTKDQAEWQHVVDVAAR